MSKKFKVLISAPYFQPIWRRFESEFDKQGVEVIVPEVHERLEERQLLDLIVDIDGVICGDDRFTKKVLEKANKLKVISKWGTGIDSIDQEACLARKVAVRNTPNAFTGPVSDTTLAYALNFVRNVSSMTEAMRDGVWKKIPGKTLAECTVGIIGVGNIGRAVAKKLHPFNCGLLGFDPKGIPSEIVTQTGIRSTSLEALLRESDIVTLHCDLNSTSFHLMNEKNFSIMKETAYIINTARGPVIKEAALCNALKSKSLAGAALDVFEEEPLPSDSPLKELPNVYLAPHNSNSSPKAWENVHQNTLKNLFEELQR